jgi:hypothetical protein
MALTPGLYVPQGQVGTGAAYVHEIKDRSGYLDAIAKANEKKRLDEERQLAKLKGFDYGKVTDQAMKEHISQKYKEGLETFSKVVALGGEIDNISTDEGIQYTTWQNQIKREAETAALAESKIIDFQNKVLANAKDFDTDLYYAVLDNYKNATTPDEKLAATLDADPLLLKTFDFTKWVKEEIEPAKTDKEITDLGEDITKYQEVYNKKLDEVPKILASKRGVGLAKIAWQMYHDRGDDGFQQASFDEYVKQAIDSQRKMRQSTSESPAAKDMNIDVDVTTGSEAKKGDVVTVPSVDTTKLNIDVGEAANNGTLFSYESADNPRVPNLVIKGKGNKPEDYGLSSDYTYADPSDKNAILLPANELYRLESNHATATSIQPDDKFATAFAGKTFTDENGNPTKGSPSKIFEDQLGNTWLALTDEQGKNKTYVILRVGGLMQTYTNNKGTGQQHPFVGVAAQNQQAIEKALGVDFNSFMREYGPITNLKK